MASKSIGASCARQLSRRAQPSSSLSQKSQFLRIPFSSPSSPSSASYSQPPSSPPSFSPYQTTTIRHASNLSSILPRSGSAAETYVAYGFTQKLFEACSSQADYRIPQAAQKGTTVPKTEAGEDLGVGEGWWYDELGLLPTFSTWSQVTFLHMYLLTVRLRALPSRESFQTYSRHLIDHFSHNAEQRMDVLHGFSGRSIRNRFLRDLFIQWRGVLAAYDEGLVKGDAVLGAAVWRNIWKASHTAPGGSQEGVDWVKISTVVAYMRRVVDELAKVHEADLIFALKGDPSLPGGKKAIFGYSPLDKKLVETGR